MPSAVPHFLVNIKEVKQGKCSSFSRVRLFEIPGTVVHQVPLSMEFSRPEYWSRLLIPSLGNLPNPGIALGSPALQADSLPSEPPEKPLLIYTMRQCWATVKENFAENIAS